MSNDLKFFLYRAAIFITIATESWLLISVIGKAQLAPEQRGKWFGLSVLLVFLMIFVTIPAVIYYYHLKANRWGGTVTKEQDQVDVETLAAYSREQNDAKQNTTNNHNLK